MVHCSKCQTPLEDDSFAGGQFVSCAGCGALLQADIFPANAAPSDCALTPEEKQEGEASCFFHPSKRAQTTCSSCGRFICALCDMELEGRSICPVCLESGAKKKKFADLENERTLYDHIALSVAALPMIFVWPTIVTAPAALFLVFRYWKAPCSIVEKKRWRFVAAFAFAALQIVGWISLLAIIVADA